MNSQIKYIVQGFLILLLLPIGYLFISRLLSSESRKEKDVAFASQIDRSTLLREMTEVESTGKNLFNSRCAACHRILGHFELYGFEQRGPWSDRQNLYSWIRNPAAFMKNDKYTQELKARYGSMMQAFPDLSDMEIDAIVHYINYVGESNGF